MADQTGSHVRQRHARGGLAGTRDTHGAFGFDPSRIGLPMGMARDGEQTTLPDLGPGSVVTGSFDPSAKAPQVDNAPARQVVTPGAAANVKVDAAGITILDGALTIKDSLGNTVASDGKWQNGPGTVVIDSAGITVADGAITIEDYAGNSVLTAAGFGGAWINFLSNGVYNGGFDAGVDSSGLSAATMVGSASTDLQYRSSLSTDVPYWIIHSVTGNVLYGLVSDATYGRLLKVYKTAAIGGTLSFFQDVPIVGGKPYELVNHLILNKTEVVADKLEIYLSGRNATHGLVGVETLWRSISGWAGTFDFSVQPEVEAIAYSDFGDTVRYLRVRYVVTLATTAASHNSNMEFLNIKVRELPWQHKAIFTPDGPSSGAIEDTLFSDLASFSIFIGDASGGPRELRLSAGEVSIRPSTGGGSNATLSFASTANATPDTNLYRSAANVLASDDEIRSTFSGLAFKATAGYYQSERASETSVSYLIGLKTADTGPRIRIGTNASGYGAVYFDDGTAAAGSEDTVLYRSAADTLRTDDALIAGGGLKTFGSTYAYLQFLSAGDTPEALIDWGSGGSNILRAGVYGTDGSSTFREGIRLDANATVALLGFFGSAAVARTTWGAPTTTDTRTTFADAVTLVELAKRVGTLIKDLRSLGLLG